MYWRHKCIKILYVYIICLYHTFMLYVYLIHFCHTFTHLYFTSILYIDIYLYYSLTVGSAGVFALLRGVVSDRLGRKLQMQLSRAAFVLGSLILA